jgi:integrase
MNVDAIRDTIKQNRPNLSDSSLRGYVSVLKNLYIRVAADLDLSKAKDFFEKEYETTLAYLLKEYPFSTRKTKLASLVVFVDEDSEAHELYKKHMKQDWEQYKRKIEEQEKDDKMKKNWISQEELKMIFEKLKRRVGGIMKESSLTFNELWEIQKLIVLSIFHLIPPRRLLDYTEFKLKNFDKTADNYWEGNNLYFNRYKTAKTYGKESVSIPKELKAILSKWKRLNVISDYLLFDKKGLKMTQPQLTNLLNEILGKGRSVNALRHSFISENVLKDMPRFLEMKEMAKDLGHSVETMMMYKKVD